MGPRERKTLLFSATMTSRVAKLQRACLKNPVKIEISHKYDTAAGLQQSYVFQPLRFKMTWLAALIQRFAAYSQIVFTDRCRDVQRVTAVLKDLGFEAAGLHGQMPQLQRLGALNQFKAGRAKILVATDVASRGLDIPSVDLVINMDIPKNSKDYIHRVGRTARAGRSGRAVTLFSQYDVEVFQRIEHALGKKLPECDAVTEGEAMRLHTRVQEACKKVDMAEKEAAEGYDLGSRANSRTAAKVKKEFAQKRGASGFKQKGGKRR